MYHPKYLLTFLSFIFLASAYGSGKNDTARSVSGYIVIVVLHAEKNRIAEAKRRNDTGLLHTIVYDAEEIRKRTIMDFNDHFHACPVYYIMDSNVSKITRGNYDGLLFNADGSTAGSVPQALEANKFIIAFYTRPNILYQFEDVITDSNRWTEGSRALDYGLVLFNSKLQQFNTYRKALLSTVDKDEQKYYYKSQVCEMEYYPLAKRMESKRTERRGLAKFFGF